jgi:hypothetical protein
MKIILLLTQIQKITHKKLITLKKSHQNRLLKPNLLMLPLKIKQISLLHQMLEIKLFNLILLKII